MASDEPVDILDIVAALRADLDQREMEFGEALGAIGGVPLDAIILVSPDIGMRLTREGILPARVRISWLLPPKTAYAVDRSVFDPPDFGRWRPRR